jgi:hypothetical protein
MGLRVAPSAQTYIVDWSGTTGYPAWQWCFTPGAHGAVGIHHMNLSWAFNTEAAGPPTAPDMAQDWYVKHAPYPVITQSGGNCQIGPNLQNCSSQANHTVRARTFNTLLVGASNDIGTPSTADDTIANFSTYTNFPTVHNDFELPGLVAPGVNVDSSSNPFGSAGSGTSASAPLALGVTLLMHQRDVTFQQWPEMVRATVLATATFPVDGPRTTSLGGSDLRQGAGLLNAQKAVILSDPSTYTGPNGAAVVRGRHGRTLNFTTDFTGTASNDVYYISTDSSGRLRVVIAWDSSPTGCSTTNGSGCVGDALDGDLDLILSAYNAGSWTPVCNSSTWDSSWELCDVAVQPNKLYMAQIFKGTTVSTNTYLGIAWDNYSTSNE